jgi:D-threonate/D-erythronate kinase
VVFSGGDTAHLICRELGVTGIRLEREITPGLPSGYLMGGLADGWPVVTKAGGFGAEDALTTAVNFLCLRDVRKETAR